MSAGGTWIDHFPGNFAWSNATLVTKGMAAYIALGAMHRRIECPLLVLHGENDKIAPRDSARKLHAAADLQRKTLKIFAAEEGGAGHCQVDNRQVGVDYIADGITENV